jgi:phytanoyl-CoA hydroxylase
MQADLEQYNKNGFLVFRNFFPKEAIGAILQEARMVFYRQFVSKGYTNRKFDQISGDEFNDYLYRLFDEDVACLANCGKQAQHTIALHRLSLDENIIELLQALGLESPAVSTRPVLYFNHPKLAQKKVYYKVDAHQDWRSMQGSLNSVVIWLPLEDINIELGALEVIPGSHLWGLRTASIDNGFGMVALSPEEGAQFIPVEVQQGDLLAFSSFLVHQSGENVTSRPRWSCHFRYNDLGDPTFIRRGYPHAYIYKPIEELVTPGFPTTNEISKLFTCKK